MRRGRPREWYGDSAYGTGDLSGAIDDAGHVAAIKPKPLQAAVEGGFMMEYYRGDSPLRRKVASTIVESFLFYSGSICRCTGRRGLTGNF